MKKTILAFGETLWDLLPNGPKLGGAPCNFAYRVNSLGDEGVMISRLGQDDRGKAAESRLREQGMRTDFLQWDDALPTGTVQVKFGDNNEPDYFIVPDVAYDAIEFTDEMGAIAAQAECICFGTLVQRAETSRRTLARVLDAAPKALKLLDVNLRKNCYSSEIIAESLDRADLLKLNEHEVVFLAKLLRIPPHPLQEFCARLFEKGGPSRCVITLGGSGSFAASNEGEAVYTPGFAVKVADTCGAGDAFTAAFAHGLLRGASLADCCERGNALGAMVAACAGATEPISPADLDMFLQSAPVRVEEQNQSLVEII